MTSKSSSEYPRLFPPPQHTIAGVGRALRQRQTSCAQILEGCLAQVDEWESKVHAWVILDRDKALEEARELDNELKSGNDRGPLHGIPIGIKDIIDVAGLPTACGSKRWSYGISCRDADVVTHLLEAGALIMGKTVTTPYAWIDPPITRNPWNLERTPGGSSSGSAAAVACGMCLGAIGSQTGGSITRPASFCGIAGMKPDKRLLNHGVKPLAPSFDQVGAMARTVEDLRLILRAMEGTNPDHTGAPPASTSPAIPPRLGRFRGFFERRADPAVNRLFNEVSQIFANEGARVVELDDPIDFEQILKDHRLVMAAEAAMIHSAWMKEYSDDYPPRIRELVVEGESVDAAERLRANKRSIDALVNYLEASSKWDFGVIITPATVSTAPDPSTTGDPAFNSPWSCLRLPTVSFPIGLAADGLPVAIQLVGNKRRDFELLQIAQWCEQVVRSSCQ